MYMPWMYTPFSGGVGVSETPSDFITCARNTSWSIGSMNLRACACSAEVKKPCGKKKLEIQNVVGGPSASHLCRKATRSTKSLNHEESGLSDGYPFPFSPHGPGTCWKRKLAYMASSSALITTSPLIARPISRSMVAICPISRFILCISCARKMPSGLTEPSASLRKTRWCASLRCSLGGIWRASSSAISATISSLLLPAPPDDVRGCTAMIASKMALDSFCCDEMSAFWCSPKISGRSTSGKVEMYLRYESSGPSGGAAYRKRTSSCGQYEACSSTAPLL
mmetsp:Transcript_9756/g.25221  ORF Transcript_9756/g.25221 Transcript_9756/m.25221 type:complete len:281 (-) Transcript_9756:439-1281(-)